MKYEEPDKYHIFCSTWGMPPSPVIKTLKKIKPAGYDGCEFGRKSFAEPAGELRRRTSEVDVKSIGQECEAVGKDFSAQWEVNIYMKDFLNKRYN